MLDTSFIASTAALDALKAQGVVAEAGGGICGGEVEFVEVARGVICGGAEGEVEEVAEKD